MTVEHAFLTNDQRNVEKDALFPTAYKPELTTDDIIIRGEDAYNPETIKAPLSSEEQVQQLFHEHQSEFSQFVDLKVRNELVKQIFLSYHDKDIQAGTVNLSEVVKVINQQVKFESDRHFTFAQYLENEAIPAARTRHGFEDSHGNPSDYLDKDVPILENREEAHLAMVDFLAEIEASDDEASFALAETTVKRLLPDARDEVVVILKEQKRRLEEEKRQAAEKITELEQTIDGLTDALSERDMQLLDREMVDHLTDEAKSYAR